MKSTITLTFGDQAENHVGMQKIGTMALNGFTYDDLVEAKKKFEEKGCKCRIVNLSSKLPKSYTADKAYVLVIRKGVDFLLNEGTDELLKEQNTLTPDKKAFMYGRVVNKNARYNLCFSDTAQKADYEKGKGTIVAYSKVPLLSKLRDGLPEFLGNKSANLTIEGNYYYDSRKCGIGWHGDGERKRVIGIRLGATIPLHYQWFFKGKPVGDRIKLNFRHGDVYVMSEKATGNDWKLKNIPTLRHAAGAKKFLEL
ncbi:2OG-Fe(II) oxygenase [Fadolivirus algeromassiliense]|uniref:2OG-Fe(II) oxygenase n=1 Tax=Fadolivirus FV1/VV64 TaxID=3070911 RepID=A0A7D3R1W5_9VIRU|nr:2OG-Fe(II) oxygenase [Fadolivirus algeromassiliense]QKF94842.1 2OG-Fe(II) oxygenase [Fadolivirus FV1/VV64]